MVCECLWDSSFLMGMAETHSRLCYRKRSLAHKQSILKLHSKACKCQFHIPLVPQNHLVHNNLHDIKKI